MASKMYTHILCVIFEEVKISGENTNLYNIFYYHTTLFSFALLKQLRINMKILGWSILSFFFVKFHQQNTEVSHTSADGFRDKLNNLIICDSSFMVLYDVVLGLGLVHVCVTPIRQVHRVSLWCVHFPLM